MNETTSKYNIEVEGHNCILLCTLLLLLFSVTISGKGIVYNKDFSPAEGLTIKAENPYREEICLNGYWNLQISAMPKDWKQGHSPTPELPMPEDNKWEDIKIKIPSAINVNDWGHGVKVGAGTNQPYAPSSVYFPSYPEHWIHARMAWLKKNFVLPKTWTEKRIILHFEAIAGESRVLVNGKQAGTNFESHLPFEVDITDYLIDGQENEILLGVRHSKLFDKSHPEYSKFGATYPPGSNTDDLLGIWQDVFLFAVPEIRVTDVFVKPWLDRDELEFEIQLINQSSKKKKVKLSGNIREWLNKAFSDTKKANAEISWELGDKAMSIASEYIQLMPGESKTISVKSKVNNQLKKWSPDAPNLYTLLLNVEDGKNTYDCKATRFGWRQFKIVNNEFHLNGEKIQCIGDIQHPFSAYICSRRFAWAWYQMIKDFGGNAVRPHAQPWPRVYYDLADEMGLMVLDETALFGSSIRLNLEEEITWQRSQDHLDRLILRDRNHPSVIGWSAGNEMFAIALLNKPEKEVSDKWDQKMLALTLSAKRLDPTRDFITLDGDKDMDGQLPVWSKHFGHGLRTGELPQDLNKPLIVGESGATYYGRPEQIYQFAGEKVYESYYGRSEALAVDVYQNAVHMARPHLAYFSPSEVCWFGIEHMNLGYHDFSRLPDLNDGIFAGKPYEEGIPGYQYERIPPYVTTFNPGLDPTLPLYKPLPMFEALKAALSSDEPLPCKWDAYDEYIRPERLAFPESKYKNPAFIGTKNGLLHKHLWNTGIRLEVLGKETDVLIIESDNIEENDIPTIEKQLNSMEKKGGLIFLMLSDKEMTPAIEKLLPLKVSVTSRHATALEANRTNQWGKYFDLPSLYFAEIEGDRRIVKQGLSGELVDNGTTIFSASRTDWSLFNENPENKKCAQVVLYEHLQKPSGVSFVTYVYDKITFVLSTIDYRIQTKETKEFWKSLYSAMEIKHFDDNDDLKNKSQKEHDLLLDGPVD